MVVHNVLVSFLFLAACAVTTLADDAKPAAAVSPESLVRSAAPEFALPDLDGKTVRLSDFRGKAVVLNFWATWCAPCRHEIPWLIDLQKRYGPEGLVVIGVSMDSTRPDDAAKFSKQAGINYPIVLGPGTGVTRQYGGVWSLPTTFYIGRDGTITAVIPGVVEREEMEELAKAALATDRGSR
jgi:peroxiredoxin